MTNLQSLLTAYFNVKGSAREYSSEPRSVFTDNQF